MPKSYTSRLNENGKEMKTLFYSFVLLLMTAFCAISCNNSDDSISEISTKSSNISERLSQGIVEIMENKDSQFDDGGYVVYDAESDSMVTCSDFIYGLVTAIYDSVDKGTVSSEGSASNARKASPSVEWKLGCKCKEKANASKWTEKIAKEIPANANFEVHVEPQNDGTYKVWYRIVN